MSYSCAKSFDTNDAAEDSHSLVPKVPEGVSGTALAASLLRDGWSVSSFKCSCLICFRFLSTVGLALIFMFLQLAKIYAKYQEAVDALRHEQLGRKEIEAVLQRVCLMYLLSLF